MTSVRKYSALVVASLIVLLFGTFAPAPASQSSRQTPINRFLYSRHSQQDAQGYYYQPIGLCEDYPQDARSQSHLDRDFSVLRNSGAKLVRVGVSWQDIEYSPGHYDWSFWDRLVDTAVANHVTLIPYVCYTPEWAASNRHRFWTQPPRDPRLFADFMGVIASRYKGKVQSWELWNEPDNTDFWSGTVGEYAELVKAGAQAVRSADPAATIVLGGMSGKPDFIQTLIRDYDIGDYVDVVNFHAYFETWNDYRMEHMSAYIQSMSVAAEQARTGVDLWLAEFGYSDMPGSEGSGLHELSYQHTPAFQAVALWRSQILALAAGKLSLSAWYRINDLPADVGVIGDDNNRYLGIVDVNGDKKPAFFALRFYNQLFDQPVRCIDRLVRIHAPAKSQSVVHVFERKDRSVIIAAWLRTPEPGDLPSSNGPDNRREEIAITMPRGVSGSLDGFDTSGQSINSGAALAGGKLTGIALTGSSIFIARLAPH